jgi:hypothetical protein
VYSIIRELTFDPQTVSIGGAMQLARLSFSPPFLQRSVWMDWTDYNLYGDPSVKLATEAPASIDGVVFQDSNLDGLHQAGEPGVERAVVYLDANNSGEFDQGEPSAVTGADGHYAFSDVRAGTQHVRLASLEGWAQYSPACGTAHEVPVSPGMAATNLDFGLRPASAISGYVWNDLDANGSWDAEEPGLNGWAIYLDANGNGLRDIGEFSTLTHNGGQGKLGYYELEDLPPGTYVVSQVVCPGWTQLSPIEPGVHYVDVLVGQNVTGVSFRNVLPPDIIEVSTLDDVVNGDLTPGDLSLREALALAAERPGSDTIVFAADLAGGTIALGAAGTLPIDSDVAIHGIPDASATPGVDERISISGKGACGVVTVAPSVTAELHSLVLTQGNAANGAGLRIDSGADVQIADMKISANAATGHGGGVYVQGASVSLVRCEIADNTTALAGGGLYGSEANTTITIAGCSINNNTSTDGGGVCLDEGAIARISESAISGNHAATNWPPSSGRGGAVTVFDSTLTITNSLIVENSAENDVGGVYLNNSSATFANVTIASNTANNTSYGYGIHSDNSSNVTLHSAIVASHGGNADIMGSFNGASSNNLIGIRGSSTTGISNAVNGNLVGTAASPVGPGFADPASGNFGLASASQCVNRGDSSRLPLDLDDLDGDGNTSEPVPFDLDGKQRIIYATVDIGAYEYRLFGDANYDGTVDDKDASILASHWHKAGGWADGDFNGDGKVNDMDAAIMAAHWTVTPPEATELPASSPLLSDGPVAAAMIGPRPASATPTTRRRLSDPREAAREAAFAEAYAYSPSREQRLAAAWSYEVGRSSARQRLTAPADRVAARAAIDLLVSGRERH